MERLKQIRARVYVMPLGSGALAGNPFAIDRAYLAQLLEFDSISSNSLLAVGDVIVSVRHCNLPQFHYFNDILNKLQSSSCRGLRC